MDELCHRNYLWMVLDGEKTCLGSMKNLYKNTMKTVTNDTYFKLIIDYSKELQKIWKI